VEDEMKEPSRGISANAAPAALVGHSRGKSRPTAGLIHARPMASDAEVRFMVALRRVAAALVQEQLRGSREEIK
jgi:hypothetical protein